MHRFLKKLFMACALVCMASLLLAPAVFADTEKTVTLPAKLSLTGNLPAGAGPYHFTLKGQDAATPMPADSTGDTKTVTMPGAGPIDFGTITYPTVGEYVYTIRQEPGSASYMTYDTRVYTAKVLVAWKDAVVGGEMVVTYGLAVTGDDAKQDEIAFSNIGTVPPPHDPSPTPVPTVTPAPVPTPTPSQPPIFGWLPQTSDDAPLLLWAVLGGAALVVLVVLLLRKNRKNKPK